MSIRRDSTRTDAPVEIIARSIASRDLASIADLAAAAVQLGEDLEALFRAEDEGVLAEDFARCWSEFNRLRAAGVRFSEHFVCIMTELAPELVGADCDSDRDDADELLDLDSDGFHRERRDLVERKGMATVLRESATAFMKAYKEKIARQP
jgi:hypothetical protein